MRTQYYALYLCKYYNAASNKVISPQLEQLKKEGEVGRKKINQYARYGTVFLAMVQGYGVAVGIENMSNSQGVQAVMDPGMFFRFTTVITLVSGTIFLVWLGADYSKRIGNGISLIIFTGIVAQLPIALSTTFELGRTGAIYVVYSFPSSYVCRCNCLYGFYRTGTKKNYYSIPKRQQQGAGSSVASSSHLPLKINTAGVIPPIFASSLYLFTYYFC